MKKSKKRLFSRIRKLKERDNPKKEIEIKNEYKRKKRNFKKKTLV